MMNLNFQNFYENRITREEQKYLRSKNEVSLLLLQNLINDLRGNIYQQFTKLNDYIEQKFKSSKDEMISKPIALKVVKFNMLEKVKYSNNNFIK